jgi:hypothetical protein
MRLLVVCATSVLTALVSSRNIAASPRMAMGKDQSHIKVFRDFTCSGKVGSYSAGIADRSIGSGDSMCYFISNSDIGRRILKDCKVGVGCKVLGTVNNDKRAGDWSPVIVEINEISRGEH